MRRPVETTTQSGHSIKTAPRGALEELGEHKDQKHNYRRAEEGQLTPFEVRVVITL